MKILGSELSKFITEAWPDPEDSWYWDHDKFEDEPEENVLYDTDDLGPIIWQGEDNDPTDGEDIDLEKAIKKWRKTRNKDMFTVWIPKDKTEEFLNCVKSIGGTK